MKTLNYLTHLQPLEGKHNDYHYNRFVYIKDNILISLIAKTGCTTLAYSSYKFHNGFDYDKGHNNFWSNFTNYSIQLNKPYKLDKSTKIVITYRDPIDRFLSAKKTICDGQCILLNYDTYIQYISYFMLHKYDLNYHIQPQYKFWTNVDFNDVDTFVETKYLQNYLQSIGISTPILNDCKNDKIYSENILNDNLDIFKKYYQKDYEIIEKIRNSNKNYIP